ncbi:UDP-glucose--hexose-1-phosphate uridylyltransferase [Priestia megaterium]|uniref:UDP-glucose--hexose-1-phosphate uridylyltransferase n=1 Tax=Priestia megaterium TaxID=1404 RepID=UPI001BE75E89|nr:UDP-glucose--hexose-1-phosphate uridylyltransferase [Priestia megaterium]MBT2258253.1 UDP-glucose--hexose-1-phosphate uridylyltransferase [Priestia megaterium]MBT2277363.1 UDP-glucose--hexose-1-phosphate uridylyltransferase [Priestia megaterium]
MSVNIHEEITRLIQYGLQKNLLTKWDIDVVRNKLLEVLRIDECIIVEVKEERLEHPAAILDNMLDWAAENNRIAENSITYRDLFDTKIMGCFASMPSEVNRTFYDHYQQSPQKATSYYYKLSKDIHYIRRDRIAKNERWVTNTDFGELEITINLSKPEKDPKAIAASKSLKESNYPLCLLCKENAGYAGRINHPARQNHRIIPVEVQEELWYMQFSPYVYYNEHAIVFASEHTPMHISKQTFKRLLAFVEQFPHYFLGSNADLPIVGGSILTHDHFQGGYHDFPMAKAKINTLFSLKAYPDVKAGIVHWPMSVVRLQSSHLAPLVEAADFILKKWKSYSDQSAGILAFTDQTPHNTVTPIARKRGDLYELDLVLRNNRTNGKHPDGIYHPHAEVHHIKKENIGLIEVMGLAVLPGRLKDEMSLVAKGLVQNNLSELASRHDQVKKHVKWAEQIKKKYPHIEAENVQSILQQELGLVFATILEHAGVFKQNTEGQLAFSRFMNSLNEA